MAARKTSLNPSSAVESAATRDVKVKPKNLLSFCSLFLIIIVPLGLTMAIMHTFGSSKEYEARAKALWFPSLTMIHLATVGSTVLMSRAAWLVWANGGLDLGSDALPLYMSQVSLSIVWDPLVLRVGDAGVGLVFSSVNFGTLLACYYIFGIVNPSSKQFVFPCLLWGGYLSFVTFMLMFV